MISIARFKIMDRRKSKISNVEIWYLLRMRIILKEKLAYKEVTNLYRNQRDDIIKLHVEEQIIETTDNHPFWGEGIKDGSLQMNYR